MRNYHIIYIIYSLYLVRDCIFMKNYQCQMSKMRLDLTNEFHKNGTFIISY